MVTAVPRRSPATLASFARAHDTNSQRTARRELHESDDGTTTSEARNKILVVSFFSERLGRMSHVIRCRGIGICLLVLSAVVVLASVGWMTVANRVAVRHEPDVQAQDRHSMMEEHSHEAHEQLRQEGGGNDGSGSWRVRGQRSSTLIQSDATHCEADILAAGLFFPLVPIGVGPAVQRLMEKGCLPDGDSANSNKHSHTFGNKDPTPDTVARSPNDPTWSSGQPFPRECLITRIQEHSARSSSATAAARLVFRKGGSGEWSGELMSLTEFLGRSALRPDQSPVPQRLRQENKVDDERNGTLCVGQGYDEGGTIEGDTDFCIILRHHRRTPDIGDRLRHTPVSKDVGWARVIQHTIGPDEMYGSVVCGTEHLPEIAAPVLPVGFAYLGFERSGATEIYLSVLHLPEQCTGPRRTLQLRLVHEYDEYWGINEVQPTTLRNVHKLLVDDAVTIPPRRSAPQVQQKPRLTSPVQDKKKRARNRRASGVTGPQPWCRGAPHERAVFHVIPRRVPKKQPEVIAVAPLPSQRPKRRAYEPIRGSDAVALKGWSCRYLSVALPPTAEEGGDDDDARMSLRDRIVALSQTGKHKRKALVSNRPASAPVSSSPSPREQWKILFVGDSQIRSLFWHWVAVMENTEVVWTKVFNHTERHARASGRHMAAHHDGDVFATSTFLWDAYLRRMAQWHLDGNLTRVGEAFDVVVFGFGSWPASYGGYTLSDVQRVLEELAVVASRLMNEYGTTVIYAGSPVWPKHRKNNPGFRITNTRLQMYHVLARRALAQERSPPVGDYFTAHRSAAMRWLPFFDVSANMGKMKREDGMHYDGSVVMFGLVDALATFLTAEIERSPV